MCVCVEIDITYAQPAYSFVCMLVIHNEMLRFFLMHSSAQVRPDSLAPIIIILLYIHHTHVQSAYGKEIYLLLKLYDFWIERKRVVSYGRSTEKWRKWNFLYLKLRKYHHVNAVKNRDENNRKNILLVKVVNSGILNKCCEAKIWLFYTQLFGLAR